MTRQEIEAVYEVKDGRIVSPGKFENQPIFAPYFWDIGLNGMADDNNGKVYKFQFFSTGANQVEFTEWPELKEWLGRKRTLRLSEDSQGFVHCY